MYPSTVEVVQNFMATQRASRVPNKDTRQTHDYDASALQLRVGVHSSVSEFEEIDKQFKNAMEEMNRN